jgi:hypothetical protein
VLFSAAERDRAVGTRRRHRGIEADVRARDPSAFGQQFDNVLPVDPVWAAAGLARHHDVAARVDGIAAVDPHAAGQHAVQHPERCENPRHVVVDGDAVALAAQRVAAFVHPHRPAALGEGYGGDKTAKSRADDFHPTGLHAPLLHFLAHRGLVAAKNKAASGGGAAGGRGYRRFVREPNGGGSSSNQTQPTD